MLPRVIMNAQRNLLWGFFCIKHSFHKHFRIALYGNGVYTSLPHDEAEVSLRGDNKAVGGGIISTVLIKKLAVSLTGGIIKPFDYNGTNGVSLRYGNAYNYSLSFGYLVYPFKYKNYQQTNIVIYSDYFPIFDLITGINEKFTLYFMFLSFN